jgi:hypothetical protein
MHSSSLGTLILHLICRVMDVKAVPTLKLASVHKFDSSWVVVEWVTKFAHLIPVNIKCRVEKYAEIYIARVLYLHGVLKTIISDRGLQFVARFWQQLHASHGTHLIHSSAYHPQTDGQTERVNQILEDMLRACVMENQGSWDKDLPLAKFSYNNSYQESLKMAPFEVYTDVDTVHRSIGLS